MAPQKYSKSLVREDLIDSWIILDFSNDVEETKELVGIKLQRNIHLPTH